MSSIYLCNYITMEKLTTEEKKSWTGERHPLFYKMKDLLIWLFMLSPFIAQSQSVHVWINPAPMVWYNIEIKQALAGVNLELLTLAYKDWSIGAGMTPAVYFQEKMPGKLWPSIQLRKQWKTGEEIGAILGAHGWDPFVGLRWKVSLFMKKKQK